MVDFPPCWAHAGLAFALSRYGGPIGRAGPPIPQPSLQPIPQKLRIYRPKIKTLAGNKNKSLTGVTTTWTSPGLTGGRFLALKERTSAAPPTPSPNASAAPGSQHTTYTFLPPLPSAPTSFFAKPRVLSRASLRFLALPSLILFSEARGGNCTRTPGGRGGGGTASIPSPTWRVELMCRSCKSSSRKVESSGWMLLNMKQPPSAPTNSSMRKLHVLENVM